MGRHHIIRHIRIERGLSRVVHLRNVRIRGPVRLNLALDRIRVGAVFLVRRRLTNRLHRLTSSSAFTRPNPTPPLNWECQVSRLSREHTVGIGVEPGDGQSLGSGHPGTPLVCRTRIPRVVLATGSPADCDRLGVASSATVRPRWLVCDSHIGPHPALFPVWADTRTAVGRSATLGSSPVRRHTERRQCGVKPVRNWRCDGAYPRRERRGSAPVQPMMKMSI